MKTTKNQKVYLTFQTDPETAFILKDFAHKIGKTQPELINEICKDFIENLIEFAKELEVPNTEDQEKNQGVQPRPDGSAPEHPLN